MLIVLAFFLFYILIRPLEPFYINNEGISRISILGIEGEAKISEDKEMNDVIRVINSTKAIIGEKTLYEELGGDTPDISVKFYNDNDDVIHELRFYGSVIT